MLLRFLPAGVGAALALGPGLFSRAGAGLRPLGLESGTGSVTGNEPSGRGAAGAFCVGAILASGVLNS